MFDVEGGPVWRYHAYSAFGYQLHARSFPAHFRQCMTELFFSGVVTVNVSMIEGGHTRFETVFNHSPVLGCIESGSPGTPFHTACNDRGELNRLIQETIFAKNKKSRVTGI
jgi:hypothetical protein